MRLLWRSQPKETKEEIRMFKSLMDVASDVVKIAAAPVEIAADVTHAVTKPLADAAQEVTKEVKSVTKEITKD